MKKLFIFLATLVSSLAFSQSNYVAPSNVSLGINPTFYGSWSDVVNQVNEISPFVGDKATFKYIRVVNPTLALMRPLLATNVTIIHQVRIDQAYDDVINRVKAFKAAGFNIMVEAPNEYLVPYAADTMRSLYNDKANYLKIWSNGLYDALKAYDPNILYIGPSLTPIYPTVDAPLTGFKCDYGNMHSYADFTQYQFVDWFNYKINRSYNIPATWWQYKCYSGKEIFVTEFGCETLNNTPDQQLSRVSALLHVLRYDLGITKMCVYQFKDNPNVVSAEGRFGIYNKPVWDWLVNYK